MRYKWVLAILAACLGFLVLSGIIATNKEPGRTDVPNPGGTNSPK